MDDLPRKPGVRGLSAKTKRALRRVDAGDTPYRAAKESGINLNTIYRVLKRIRTATEPKR